MNVRYRVELSQAERDELTAMLGGGKHAARKLKRAQILLAADGGRRDEEIARTVSVSLSTVGRTKRRFVEGNLERALSEEPRPGAERKLTGKEEALLVATACAKPPAGRKRWTLTLLADTMVKLTDHDSLSGETVRRRLAENDLKPWRRDMWCIPHVDGEYVARMEDVLDLYAEAPNPARPLVCFDETPVQLIGEVRQPVPAQPGQRERYDYEYRRNGTVNLFVTFDPHRGWRNVKVTDRRAAVDYAHCMRDLVDVHYPDAACIRVVQDNLSIHKPGALYEAFAPAEARRILRRLEFHFTPKHASWLNMVECEISVLQRQCLGRRIDDPKRLRNEIAAWQKRRNKTRARIKWMFTTDKARAKLGRAYPATAKESKSLRGIEDFLDGLEDILGISLDLSFGPGLERLSVKQLVGTGIVPVRQLTRAPVQGRHSRHFYPDRGGFVLIHHSLGIHGNAFSFIRNGHYIGSIFVTVDDLVRDGPLCDDTDNIIHAWARCSSKSDCSACAMAPQSGKHQAQQIIIPANDKPTFHIGFDGNVRVAARFQPKSGARRDQSCYFPIGWKVGYFDAKGAPGWMSAMLRCARSS